MKCKYINYTEEYPVTHVIIYYTVELKIMMHKHLF